MTSSASMRLYIEKGLKYNFLGYSSRGVTFFLRYSCRAVTFLGYCISEWNASEFLGYCCRGGRLFLGHSHRGFTFFSVFPRLNRRPPQVIINERYLSLMFMCAGWMDYHPLPPPFQLWSYAPLCSMLIIHCMSFHFFLLAVCLLIVFVTKSPPWMLYKMESMVMHSHV